MSSSETKTFYLDCKYLGTDNSTAKSAKYQVNSLVRYMKGFLGIGFSDTVDPLMNSVKNRSSLSSTGVPKIQIV